MKKGRLVNQTLNTQLEANRTALTALCRKYGVARLDLFGSGTTDEWNTETSDLDFVIVFRPEPKRSLADRYLGPAEALEALFERRVDLLTERAIRNPYFRRNVDATRSRVYGE